MILHFNVKGEKRKAMVKAIEEEVGLKAKYLGVPSCAYKAGDFTVGKNGELEFEDTLPLDFTSSIVDACVMASGESPSEWDENLEAERTDEHRGDVGLTIAIPKNRLNICNLDAILLAKGDLIQKALGTDDLIYEDGAYEVRFPWFKRSLTAEESRAYTNFISALCEMSRKQKRINSTSATHENEKYAFRCFLLRLGFIGEEFKDDRRILMKNLTGSAAFKSGAKKEDRA